MRWANENRYDDLLKPAASRHSVPLPLLKGLIAHESQFSATAIRTEARLNDASRGLMQILYATAQGEGYRGSPEGLFDPATNVEYGLRYLRRQLDRAGGNVRGGLSAYNGGWRPTLGFGRPATRSLRVCLAYDTAGACVRWHTVHPGEYANQQYVDSVIDAVRYFAALHAESLAQIEQQTEQAAAGCLGALLVPALLAGGLVGVERMAAWLLR